jgi:choline kinase
MGEMTVDNHKTLLPIRNKPILKWMLDALLANGVDETIFVAGFHKSLVQNWVSDNFPDLNATWLENPEYASTNTAYSVWLAREAAMVGGDDVLLLNGDVVLDSRVIARTLEPDGLNVLATRLDRVAEEEVKVTLKDGRVTEIGKHLSPQIAAGESVGINRLGCAQLPDLFETLQRRIETGDGRNEYYEHAFNELVQAGAEFRTADVTDLPVIEIDTPEDYREAQEKHASRLEE